MTTNWYKKAIQDYSKNVDDENRPTDLFESEREGLEEDAPKFESTPFEAVCYHGTVIQPGEGLFQDLSTDYAEYEAIWVTEEEDVAEEFSRRHESSYRSGENKGFVPVVFKVNVRLQNAAQIYDIDEWRKFVYHYDIDMNLPENVDFLRNMGYDGWITLGGLGGRQYRDIASFNPSNTQIFEAKVLTPQGWTEYLPIQEAQDLVAQMQGSNEEVEES